MSQRDLEDVLQRFTSDLDFAKSLMRNFDSAIAKEGYSLSDEEMAHAKKAFAAAAAAPSSSPPPASSPKFIPPPNVGGPPSQGGNSGDDDSDVQKAMKANKIELGKFIVALLQGTLNNAKHTYQLITLMNGLMFALGIGLFLFAAIYGALHQDIKLGAFFAGLGVITFVTFFMLGPINKTQDALSNLIQAEIAFMNYYDQMMILENYAFAVDPQTGLPTSANLERASDLLQQRTLETAQLLQTYLETRPSKEGMGILTGHSKVNRTVSTAVRQVVHEQDTAQTGS